jgi:4-amino-4-deoxy-L-arabinose transferase-like glycosyltransferase
MVIDSLARGPLATLVLLLLSLALYVPGMARLPVTDRDEARFAQATRQMVETGDYVRIRFQAEPRHKKPAGIHWLQAAAVRIAAGGDTGRIWAYRLPSALGATAAVLALFALARPVFGAGTALVAALILGSALLTGIEAHIAKTDAALLLAAVLAEGALMGLYHRAR